MELLKRLVPLSPNRSDISRDLTSKYEIYNNYLKYFQSFKTLEVFGIYFSASWIGDLISGPGTALPQFSSFLIILVFFGSTLAMKSYSKKLNSGEKGISMKMEFLNFLSGLQISLLGLYLNSWNSSDYTKGFWMSSSMFATCLFSILLSQKVLFSLGGFCMSLMCYLTIFSDQSWEYCFQDLIRLITMAILCIYLSGSYSSFMRQQFQSQYRLISSNAAYTSFIKGLSSCSVIFSKEGGIIFANESAHKLLQLENAKDVQSLVLRCHKFKKPINMKNHFFKDLGELMRRALEKGNNFEKNCSQFLLEQESGGKAIFHCEVFRLKEEVLDECSTFGLTLVNLTDKVSSFGKPPEEYFHNNIALCQNLINPLNTANGMALFAKKSASGKQKEVVQKMLDSIYLLTHKLNQILDYSQLCLNDFAFHFSDFSLPELFKKMNKVFSSDLGQKKIETHFVMDEDIHFVRNDYDRISQVIINLFMVLLKNQQKGKIVLMAKRKKEQQDAIRISFKMVGGNLSVDEIQNGKNKEFLGLIVSQKICKKMNSGLKFGKEGDDIVFEFTFCDFSYQQFESEDISGMKESCFDTETVISVVPTEPSQRQTALNYQFLTTGNLFSPPPQITVLIVDDYQLNRFILKKILLSKYPNVQIHQAQNGVQAVEVYEKLKDSAQNLIIFMDIQMPVKDGISAAKDIRAISKSNSHPYIISLTAFSSEEERRKCFQVGMNQFMTKPLTPKKLQSTFSLYMSSIETTE